MINVSSNLTGNLSGNAKSIGSNTNNNGEEFSKVFAKGISSQKSGSDKKQVKDGVKTSMLLVNNQDNIKGKLIKDEKIVKDDSPKYENIDKKRNTKDKFTDEDIVILSQLLGITKNEMENMIEGVINESCEISHIGMVKFDILQLIMDRISVSSGAKNGDNTITQAKIENALNELVGKDEEVGKALFEFFKNGHGEDIVTFLKSTAEKAEGFSNGTLNHSMVSTKVLEEDFIETDNGEQEGQDIRLNIKDKGIIHESAKVNFRNSTVQKYNIVRTNDNEMTNRMLQPYSDNLKNNTMESQENLFLKSLIRNDVKVSSEVDDIKVNNSIEKLNTMVDFKNYAQWSVNEDTNSQQGNVNIRKEHMPWDIVKSIRLMNLSNMKELTLKVIPKELGELIVTVSMEDGILKANIKASTKEAYDLMQNNMESIKEKLNMENTRIQEFSVDIYDQNSTTGNKDSFRDNENLNYHSQKRIMTNDKTDKESNAEMNQNNTANSYDVLNMLA